MGTEDMVSITYKNLKNDISVGTTILIDDGEYEELLRLKNEINEKIKELRDEHEDLMRYLALNHELHELILKFNRNKKAYELFKYQNTLINSLRKAYTPSYARVQEAYLQHKKILDAFGAKNRNELRDATEEHVSSAMKNFICQYTEN